jgi:hypothetical protein
MQSLVNADDSFNYGTCISSKSVVNTPYGLFWVSQETGKINNYGYGSNNDMETEDLIVRGSVGGGVSVISGDINVNSGAIIISNQYLQVGSGSNSVKMERVSKTLGTGTVATVNFSGSGATGGTGPVGYMTIPRLTTADINAIIEPQLGSLVYDVSLNVFKGCTGSSSVAGASNWATL